MHLKTKAVNFCGMLLMGGSLLILNDGSVSFAGPTCSRVKSWSPPEPPRSNEEAEEPED